MSPVTHALLPLWFGHRWIPKREKDGIPSFKISGILALSGLLPDLLSPHISLDARHASPPHSLTGLACFATLVAVVCATRIGSAHKKIGALCVAAYAAHIACDLIAGGVPLFRPFSRVIVGQNYIPYWMWDAADLVLIVYVYLTYRWLPLRRRLRKVNPLSRLTAPASPPDRPST